LLMLTSDNPALCSLADRRPSRPGTRVPRRRIAPTLNLGHNVVNYRTFKPTMTIARIGAMPRPV
jgi:hypothetical protein